MALLGALTTWSAGDKLTATALNNEFLNILDALNGSDADNIKLQYTSSDLPTLQLINSHASGIALQIGDGTDNDLVKVHSDGRIESTVATGTAPLVVASETVVTNLNADKVDGIQGTAIMRKNQASETIDGGSYTDVIIDSTLAASLSIGRSSQGMRLYSQSTTGGYLQAWTGSAWQNVLYVGPNGVETVQGYGFDLNGNNEARIQTLTDAATITWDADSGSHAQVTLTANRTLGNISNAKAGGIYWLTVVQPAVGGKTLSFSSNYKVASGGSGVSLTTQNNGIDLLKIYARSSSELLVTQIGTNYQ